MGDTQTTNPKSPAGLDEDPAKIPALYDRFAERSRELFEQGQEQGREAWGCQEVQTGLRSCGWQGGRSGPTESGRSAVSSGAEAQGFGWNPLAGCFCSSGRWVVSAV